MKNSQFKINIILKSGKIQAFKKRKDKWIEISTKGNMFPATAEQVLNHMLPVLAKKKGAARIEVKYSPRKKA